MVVGEEHQRLHQLCQRPAVLPWLQQSLWHTTGVGETPQPSAAHHSPVLGKPVAGIQERVWEVPHPQTHVGQITPSVPLSAQPPKG